MGQSIKIGKMEKGFTLVELLIVIVVIGILLTTTRPAYNDFIVKSKESALKKNLYIMRDAIDAYSVDNKDDKKQPKYPSTLDELVKKKYIRYIPEDPISGNKNWITVPSESGRSDIYDIKSSSSEKGTNGVPYNEW